MINFDDPRFWLQIFPDRALQKVADGEIDMVQAAQNELSFRVRVRREKVIQKYRIVQNLKKMKFRQIEYYA